MDDMHSMMNQPDDVSALTSLSGGGNRTPAQQAPAQTARAPPTQVSAAQTNASARTGNSSRRVRINLPGVRRGAAFSQVLQHNSLAYDVPMVAGVCLLNGLALKNVVLLDNQSTCHVFCPAEAQIDFCH